MDNPLVSVVVITYNSAETIIETLESIKAQTYQNIELIISDDYSKDKTIIIAEKWLGCNQERFKRVIVNISDKNKGIPANCNNGCRLAAGIWIKIIAGDDKLLPNCISDYVGYIIDNPDANIVFSRVVGFGNMEAAKQWPLLNVKRFFDNLTPLQFRIILSTQNFLPAASVFLKKSVWKGLGGYEESIPLLEDWPFWVKAMSNGYTFDFMDKETVAYRFSEMSISQGITPHTKIYLVSDHKAKDYASRSLKDLGILYSYLFYTRKLLSMEIPFINMAYVVFILNSINPAYYKYRKTNKLFMKLINS